MQDASVERRKLWSKNLISLLAKKQPIEFMGFRILVCEGSFYGAEKKLILRNIKNSAKAEVVFVLQKSI